MNTCPTCGQSMPLELPKLDKLDALTELKAALGRRNPVGKSTDERLSQAQLGAISAICRASGMNAPKECKAALGCEPECLTVFAARHFIPYLTRIAKERGEAAALTES
ncbi:MAG TPA: hypothetical protein VF747_03455 [Blastocatellia bacterium]|jgi:hypothetical protein